MHTFSFSSSLFSDVCNLMEEETEDNGAKARIELALDIAASFIPFLNNVA